MELAVYLENSIQNMWNDRLVSCIIALSGTTSADGYAVALSSKASIAGNMTLCGNSMPD